MKTFFLFAFCLVFSAMVWSQEKSLNPGQSEMIPPEFNGKNFEMLTQGKPCASLNDYLRGCACYPDECISQKAEGTEVIEFKVTTGGRLTDFRIVNSVSPEIDKQVIALLKNTNGMWTPGNINGVPVSMKKEISVTYKWAEFEELGVKDFTELAQLYFRKGSKQLLVKNNPERALKHFNNGIRYLPNNESLLMLRGICRYELGDLAGARLDWNRMSALGNGESYFDSINHRLKNFKGYAELSQMIDN